METIEPEQSNKQASQKHKTGNKQSLEKTGAGLPKQSNWQTIEPETSHWKQSHWQTITLANNRTGNNHTDKQCRNALPE